MLFDEWNISTEPLAQLAVTKMEKVANHAKLTWPVELGYAYRVEYSNNLTVWDKTLAGSLLTPTESSATQVFTDPGLVSGKRFYRIKRALVGTVGL
jgi:hypothetical protein